ncbi:MAG: cytochrome c peroxidase [Saprospiraceae bacterium]
MKKWMFVGLLFAFFACQKEQMAEPEPELPLLLVPMGFPEPEIPIDNLMSRERFALGKRLFYDPILSLDTSISCASCHLAHLSFSDSLPTSPGVFNRPGVRNAPSLANVAYFKALLREGGVPNLEMQILVPFGEHNEFDLNVLEAIDRLLNDSSYIEMSWDAFQRNPDPYVLTRSIAQFERTLLSGNSPVDQYVRQGKINALTNSELRGKELFESDRLSCSTCHSGYLYTNEQFANTGLYEEYADIGRMRLTGHPSDNAVFRIPSLRNVGVTAPYMHDGSMPNLEAVIEHYNSGGKAHPNKHPLLKPLNLTETEKSDLLAFLHALTDQSFLDDPRFRQ